MGGGGAPRPSLNCPARRSGLPEVYDGKKRRGKLQGEEKGPAREELHAQVRPSANETERGTGHYNEED